MQFLLHTDSAYDTVRPNMDIPGRLSQPFQAVFGETTRLGQVELEIKAGVAVINDLPQPHL